MEKIYDEVQALKKDGLSKGKIAEKLTSKLGVKITWGRVNKNWVRPEKTKIKQDMQIQNEHIEKDSELKIEDVPLKDEGKELSEQYKQETIQKDLEDSPSLEIADDGEKKLQQELEQKSDEPEKIDFEGIGDVIVDIMDGRLKKKFGEEAMFSSEESSRMKNAFNHFIEKRAYILTKYADIINLGIAFGVPLFARSSKYGIFSDWGKKKKDEKKEQADNRSEQEQLEQQTVEIPPLTTEKEVDEASKRYQQELERKAKEGSE